MKKIPVLVQGTGKFARGTTQIGHIVTRLFRLINISSAAPLTPGQAAQTITHATFFVEGVTLTGLCQGSPDRELHLSGSGGNFNRILPGGNFSPCSRVPVGFPRATFLRHCLMGGIIAEGREKGKVIVHSVKPKLKCPLCVFLTDKKTDGNTPSVAAGFHSS